MNPAGGLVTQAQRRQPRGTAMQQERPVRCRRQSHWFVSLPRLLSGDPSNRTVTDVMPVRRIASTVLVKSFIVADSATETETVLLFKWATAVKTASRSFALPSGSGPSRGVPL